MQIITLLADQFTKTIYVFKQIAGKWLWLLRCIRDMTKNAERKTHAQGKRQISSSESPSPGQGFWERDVGLDTEIPECCIQMWPGSHLLHSNEKQMMERCIFKNIYVTFFKAITPQKYASVSIHSTQSNLTP